MVLKSGARSSSGPSSAPEGKSGQPQGSVAQVLIDALAMQGVKRVYGLPGGGSSLDLIDAAGRRGMDFVLARHEGAAVMMAAAEAELSGTLAAVLTTKGPGAANAANGIAHASLDRAPVAVITDGFTSQQLGYISHQVFDQRAMLAPLVKAHGRLEGRDPCSEIARLLAAALSPRQGPIHIELTGTAARARARTYGAPRAIRLPAPSPTAIAAARALLGASRRPVVVVGLEARTRAAWSETRRLVEMLACPALVTYKAKGIVPDTHPQYAGTFTCGVAEQSVVRQADLVVLVGVDPVEFILQPWPYSCPVLEVGFKRHPVHYVNATACLHGDIAANLASLQSVAKPGTWTLNEIADLRAAMFASLRFRGRRAGLAPESVVKIAAEEASRLKAWPRITVDAGAHMFSATAYWPCRAPNDLLISNGLASMGFALPAAIASALHERTRPVIAFTGDGGLMMCLGELATAVQQRARIVIIVFNDGSLSLIDIKQQQRKLPPAGVRWNRHDFATAAKGLGGRGYRVSTPAGYRRALRAALTGKGLALIDVNIDSSGYPEQLAAMRG
ncbi:MAG: thiamine pyrophosphate-binding protein [Betaproteobacteria bacterium]|nr:thiamine pyrophosphate-binding protein [Betaproteobacteria bacterium]